MQCLDEDRGMIYLPFIQCMCNACFLLLLFPRLHPDAHPKWLEAWEPYVHHCCISLCCIILRLPISPPPRYGTAPPTTVKRHVWPRWLPPHLSQGDNSPRQTSTGHIAPSPRRVNLNYGPAGTLDFILFLLTFFPGVWGITSILVQVCVPVCKHCDCRLQCVNVENTYGTGPHCVTLAHSLLTLSFFLFFPLFFFLFSPFKHFSIKRLWTVFLFLFLFFLTSREEEERGGVVWMRWACFGI